MEIKVLGIDIAKSVFQLHGVDARGKVVLKKRLSREALPNFMINLPTCTIGMEACSGSNYWARKLRSYGHEVKLMSPQYVKPYVKRNKTDANDGEAICEAVTRPNMRFVSIKSAEQQDIQALHRYRQRVVEEKTALANQIRGFLTEYGIIIPQGIGFLRKRLPEILEEENSELTPMNRDIFIQLYEDLKEIDKKVKNLDKQIDTICRQSEDCQRIAQI